MKNKKRHIALNFLMLFNLSILITNVALAHPYQFFIGAEGGFVEQSHNNTAYTIIDSSTDANDMLPTGEVRYVDPDYKLSGGGTIGFFFLNKSDIRFNFFINDHSAFDSLSAPDDGHLDTSLLPPNYNSASASSASSHFSYKINSFDLTLGRTLDFGSLFSMRPHVGVNVSEIHVRQHTRYEVEDDGDSIANVTEGNSVTGVGPIIGTDLSYTITQPLRIIGNLDAALLFGRDRSILQTNYTSEEDTDIHSRVHSNFEMLNAKLGVQYQSDMTNIGQFLLTAGYRVTKYLGAIPFNSLPDSNQEAYLMQDWEDTGFQGPFLSVTFLA